MSYYNTTESSGSELRGYRKKALTQNELITEFFAMTGAMHTPSQVQYSLLPNAPITSVRRAMTTLTDEGILVKTTIQRLGPYRRPEYVWKLATTQIEMF